MRKFTVLLLATVVLGVLVMSPPANAGAYPLAKLFAGHQNMTKQVQVQRGDWESNGAVPTEVTQFVVGRQSGDGESNNLVPTEVAQFIIWRQPAAGAGTDVCQFIIMSRPQNEPSDGDNANCIAEKSYTLAAMTQPAANNYGAKNLRC